MTRKKPVKLAPVEIHRERYDSPCLEDPFEIPLDDKIDLLEAKKWANNIKSFTDAMQQY